MTDNHNIGRVKNTLHLIRNILLGCFDPHRSYNPRVSVTEHTQSISTCENLKSLFLTIFIFLCAHISNINGINGVIHLNIVGSEDVRYFHMQHHINRVAPVQEIDTAAMTRKVKYISDL